jgi:hypothetical protein
MPYNLKTIFLFRFNEPTTLGPVDERLGKTHTFVDREKPDESRILSLAGTRTRTEVRREESDADASTTQSYYTIPC